MRTAKEIVEQFRRPCESIFLSKYGSEIDLLGAMKDCAILYVDGQIEVLSWVIQEISITEARQCLPSTRKIEELLKLKQEIYRVWK